METGRLLINGRWIDSPDIDSVTNAFDGATVGTVARADENDVDAALDAARVAFAKPWPVHERYSTLMSAAARIDDACDDIAEFIAREGSKTRREARREPPRAAEILRLSAEESRRATGESLPFELRPGSENRVGYWTRVPAGIVAAILPFNDPMAVAAHKVGPALAGGNSVVLKPDSRTPFSVLRMADILNDSGLPPGRLNVVTGDGPTVGAALVRDARVRVVSFTGGVRTGRLIAAEAGIKKLVLELGANSAVIVMDDADLDRAVPAISDGAFAQGGQNCLGVQRVLVHDAVYEEFRSRLVRHVEKLKAGHSLDDSIDVCSMISVEEAERIEEWIAEAGRAGGRIVAGGRREGATVWPTVLEDVPSGIHVSCDEVYGPVVALYRIADLDEGIRRANEVDFGLHGAIFTRSLDRAFRAARELEVGGVMINDSTDYRLDTMPFGGTKSSGVGREGIRHALEAMTETRVICVNL